MNELWQQRLQEGFSDAKALLNYLQLPEEAASVTSEQLFPTRVPISFAQKMRKGDLSCPLLKQVLAISKENHVNEGFLIDPLNEQAANPVQGLLHKYYGRVLITLASSCAINCRYCFRRHFPYKENQISASRWQAILEYIQADPSIHEVIMSGGDPLMHKTKRIKQYIDDLAPIAHVKTVRFHSRLPVVMPERINSNFIEMLKIAPFKIVMVIHCNHPAELCDQTKAVFKALTQAGVTLLNQSVLLKNINDSSKVLATLSHKLFEQSVMPYYLHILDKVKGTAHFDLDLIGAKKIYSQLQEKLPGYLVPKMVVEQPGAMNKTLVF